MSVRACNRCEATSVGNGRRCTRNTCKYGPFCWQHTYSLQSLQVTFSHESGTGLFAYGQRNTIVFQAGQKILDFAGESLTQAQFDRRYPDPQGTLAPYVLKNESTGLYTDSSRTNSGLARYASNCAQTYPGGVGRVRTAPFQLCNATFKARGNVITLFADQPIYAGQEIFARFVTV